MIDSSESSIGNVRFEKYPPSVARLGKTVCIEGDLFSKHYKTPNRVYTTHRIGAGICMTATGTDYKPVKALVKLGITTKQEAFDHGDKARAQDVLRGVYYGAQVDLERLQELGFVLTATQLRQMQSMKRKAKSLVQGRFGIEKKGK